MEETTEDFKRQIQTIKTQHAAETHALHAQHAAVREELDAAREELAAARGGIGLELISRLCEHLGWRLAIEPGRCKGTRATLAFAPGA